DAVGAAVGGVPAVRDRHRGEQAHGGGLAVGAGDQGDGDGVQRLPRHLVGERQCGVVPGEAAGAEADGELFVVQQQRQLVGKGAFAKGAKTGQVFGGGGGAQDAERCVVIVDWRVGRLQGGFAGVHARRCKRGQPGPFVDFGGG